MRPASRDHPIETPVRSASLKIGTTTATYTADQSEIDGTGCITDPS